MRLNRFHPIRYWLIISAIALTCFLSAYGTFKTLDLGIEASPIWFPAGIGLAALLLYGQRVWVGITLGTFLFAMSLGVPWWVAILAAFGSTLEAIVAQKLLQCVGFDRSLKRIPDTISFLALAVIFAPTLNATTNTLLGCVSGLRSWSQFASNWWTVWLGDGMGILLVTPFLLTWVGRPLPPDLTLRRLKRRWQTEAAFRYQTLALLIWAGLLIGVSSIVFTCASKTAIAHYPLEYLPFPLIIWAALQLGQRATVLSSLVVSSIAIWGVVQGAGSFMAKTNGDTRQAVLLLQTFIGVMMMTALVLAAAVAERQQSQERFRAIFEGAAIGIGLDSLDGRIVESNPALQSMLGYSREELAHMTFADFTHPDDLAVDVELFSEMVTGKRDFYQIEKRHFQRNGQEVAVRLTNSLVRDIQGNPVFTIGMVENITDLKRAQEQIQRYADIVKRMQMGLLVWQLHDLDQVDSFTLVECNPAARTMLHITAPIADLVGHRMADIFPVLMETAFPKLYAEVIRSGKVRDLGEIRYTDHQVPEGIYATKAFPLPDNCVGVIFENITDRKQAEEALQQSEARFRLVAETAACAFMVYQGNRLRYVNPAATTITEYSQEELLSIDFWQLAHPDFRAIVQERGLARQQGAAVPSRYEIKILTKTGKERWVDMNAGMVYFEGQPAALATAYDITDRKQAEAQLRFAAERERLLAEISSRIRSSLNLEAILNTTVAEVRRFLQVDRVFISHLSDTGCCRAVAESVDPQWSSVLGWRLDDGNAVAEIRHLFSDGIRVVDDTEQVEKTPFLAEYYRRCQVKAGMGIRLMLEGQVFGVLIATQCSAPRQWQPFEVDLLQQLATQVEIALQQAHLYQQVLTLAASLECQVEARTLELQERMQELQQINQVKDLLLHAVSHDLRTPTQGMLMVLNNLLRKCDDPIAVPRGMVECMLRSSENQLQLLNSLQEQQDCTAAPSIPDPAWEATNLSDALQASLVVVEAQIVKNQATVLNQITPDLPAVKANGNALKQIFEQLLTNALKHNPPGLVITLNATISEDQMLYCTIADNGIGMNRAQCDRLFHLYIRGLDNRHLTGIGLGLHRCQRLIHHYGGQIGVDSTPGQGSIFWFTLPIAG
ncbi:PAS domain S-box protein [Pantanalinema rosaneae CENA516]|uniref:sensor histidine kinase n=1 Tax=Pantanalinema rosaneae TaxID=1620701 RepID=UPI003D6DCBA7